MAAEDDDDDGSRTERASNTKRSKSHQQSKSRSKSRTRSKSRSKSTGRSKSKSRSKSRSKSKARKNFGWWDLENDPELIALLEAEGLREKAKIAADEAAMERRQEIVRKFMEKHQREHEERQREEEAAEKQQQRKSRGVAARFLHTVQSKDRETKPVVLKSVKANPLRIDVSAWEAPKFKKDAHEKQVVKNTTKTHFLFKDTKDNYGSTSRSSSNLNTGIASNTVSMLIKAFEPVQVNKGKAIIQQGTIDEHMYVVDKGTVEFRDDDGITVATGDTGTTFGDQNLLHAVPAKRTVVATESTKVYRLHQETYRGILQQRHIVEDVKRKQQEKQKKQEDERKRQEQEDKERQEAYELGKKAKKAFEEEQKRKATKAAEEEAKRKAEEQKQQEESEWWKDETNAQLQIAIRDALENVYMEDLERIRQLGEGQFGDVWLVATDLKTRVHRHESRRYEFALKMQETYDEYRTNTATAEMKMMKEVSGYPFCSMLYKSYETEESMDMLLGLIPGGELWETIHKENEETGEWVSGLSEGDARFYCMLVADTLDYLHTSGLVFRDLKPENIMIDGWGYPVVVDFGFCKLLPKGPTDKTFTFCGTPNYVAPEIVLNVGHNGGADCWALGIVIFEMISGENPFFYDEIDQIELYRSICEDVGLPLNEKLHSRQVRKLVDKLLAKDPAKRIDAKGILQHDWFAGLSLDRLRKRQIRAPWIPEGGEGEHAEYLDDDNDVAAKAAARKKREQQIEEELRRRGEEEKERREAEEQERILRELEEETRREEERERLQQEEEERLRREEEEERERERERFRREEEERLQEEEEKRLRWEEEERLREEEEKRLRWEEEERLREEEEVRLRWEEEERLREEEEERLREEEEELLRLEEEDKQRKEEKRRERLEKRRKVLEEEKIRLEEEKKRLEEERLAEQRRLEEEEERERERIRLEEEEEEERLRLEEEEEEEERLRLEEEERKLQEELEEQQRLEEEERLRQEELLRQMEEERKLKEEEEAEENRKLKEEEEAEEQKRQRRNRRGVPPPPAYSIDEDISERSMDEVSFTAGVGLRSWDASRSPSASRLHKTSIEDLVAPVPKGIVSKLINDKKQQKSTSLGGKSPGALDVRRAVKKGLVAKRLSAAKQNEGSANIPSLFSSW